MQLLGAALQAMSLGLCGDYGLCKTGSQHFDSLQGTHNRCLAVGRGSLSSALTMIEWATHLHTLS